MNVPTKTKSPRAINGWSIFASSVSLIVISGFCWLMEYSLMIPVLLLFVGIYLYFFNQAKFRLFIRLGLLLVLMVSAVVSVTQYTSLSIYFLPIAAIGMLTMLLFADLQLSFLMSFLTSVIVGLILHLDIGPILMFFIGGLTGAFSVRNARNRGHLISAGLFISAVEVFAQLLLHHADVNYLMTKEFAAHYIYPMIANGFICSFVAAATLKIFEMIFGVMTNFSLLEITDTNQPLLKRMALEAPGTWHHSLIVSQLAEAASEAVGANPLLARAGAYYHDIGKLSKAEYFTENQLLLENKHDHMEPSMSRLVILNHVKEGVELARKNKLNPIIIDFIPQHHGTSLIHFFYQRALEESVEGESVNEDDFRYPGPKPQSKETAITLLADSVEGATRALEDPNPVNIEETVKKVMNNKFIDGQLDECNLTLKEIDKISSTFTRILSAMYHSRIKYPEKKNGHNGKKSPEKSHAQPKVPHEDS